MLSKNEYGNTVWYKAARRGQVEILEKLLNWGKELQLKPEEIRNELLLSKIKNGNTACHEAAERGQVEILERLWDWAKELQLNPEEIKKGCCCQRTRMEKQPETRQHKEAKLKY